MKGVNKKLTIFGANKPRKTRKNALIRKAVKRAIHDYREAYERLAYE